MSTTKKPHAAADAKRKAVEEHFGRTLLAWAQVHDAGVLDAVEFSALGLATAAMMRLPPQGKGGILREIAEHVSNGELPTNPGAELARLIGLPVKDRQYAERPGAIARALGVLADFPGIASVRAVARKAQCNYSTLYKAPKFRDAWQRAASYRNSPAPRRGRKDSSGGIC